VIFLSVALLLSFVAALACSRAIEAEERRVRPWRSPDDRRQQ
jgi:hypothetical protein